MAPLGLTQFTDRCGARRRETIHMVYRTLAAAVVASFGASVALAQPSQSPKPSNRASGTPAHVRYIVAPTGNEARYRVREQLVSFDLPNDAVGVTKDVTGSLL